MEPTSNYLKPLEVYRNEYPWSYYQYTANNDQMKQASAWNTEANVLAAAPFSYGSYSVPFGAAGTWDWNGCYDPMTAASIAYTGASSSYGSMPFVDVAPSYHQQHQQAPFGFYMPLPSPAPSSTPSPAPSQISSCSDNAPSERSPDSDLANSVETNNQLRLLADGADCTAPFLTPPYEQLDDSAEAARKYTSLLPHEPYLKMQSTTLPHTGHSVESILLQYPDAPQTQSVQLPTTIRKNKHTRDVKSAGSKGRAIATYASEWICELCNKGFVRKIGLTQHNRVHHSGERPHQCVKCGKRFADPVLLQRHIARHQSQNKPHKCDQCPKQFVYRMDLRRHQYLHTGNEPNRCTVCSKGFARRDHMAAHELTHLRRLNRETTKQQQHPLGGAMQDLHKR
uniref:C2H2-type domain-containing protein n=1 Tax=Anopheles dirus TaxID=7168 RepID=A0A1Y9H2C2_9DIPT